VRQAAVRALGDVGEWTHAVVRALLRAADDPPMRDEVLRTLSGLSEAGGSLCLAKAILYEHNTGGSSSRKLLSVAYPGRTPIASPQGVQENTLNV
jgi:hypothetical protein